MVQRHADIMITLSVFFIFFLYILMNESDNDMAPNDVMVRYYLFSLGPHTAILTTWYFISKRFYDF